jgi:beta-lactam-binding protein with PASTA domain
MPHQISIFLKTVFPVLLGIFAVVLISIFLIRIILRIILLFAQKKYHSIVQKIQSKRAVKTEKVLPKEDSELFIEKEEFSQRMPKKNIVEKIISEKEKREAIELSETKIVDIVKPVGFWTSVILGQKLTYLISSAKLMNDNSNKGFWVSMVEAQERAQGRQKGRSL